MKRPKNSFTKEWIESIPKSINSNGCWIPHVYARDKDGYVRVSIGRRSYYLHRITVCIYVNLLYSMNFESRHHSNCAKDCFNPNHLSAGTHTDNMKDKTRDGTNHNLNKNACGNCGRPYTSRIFRRSGPRKGQAFRKCNYCANEKRKIK